MIRHLHHSVPVERNESWKFYGQYTHSTCVFPGIKYLQLEWDYFYPFAEYRRNKTCPSMLIKFHPYLWKSAVYGWKRDQRSARRDRIGSINFIRVYIYIYTRVCVARRSASSDPRIKREKIIRASCSGHVTRLFRARAFLPPERYDFSANFSRTPPSSLRTRYL